MTSNRIGSMVLLFALLGSVPAAAQQVNAGDAKVCDGQAFDHVLHIKYPDTEVTGCVGWNEGANVCTYYDSWDGGRRGTPECELQSGGTKLVTKRFPYRDKGSDDTYPFKIVLRDYDPSTGCFGKGGWWWGSKYNNEPVGPDKASACEQAQLKRVVSKKLAFARALDYARVPIKTRFAATAST